MITRNISRKNAHFYQKILFNFFLQVQKTDILLKLANEKCRHFFIQ